MGKTGLSIEYTNNRKVYAPGDVVEGTIQIELKKTKKLKRESMAHFYLFLAICELSTWIMENEGISICK